MNQQQFEQLIKLLKQFRESASNDASTQYTITSMELEELEHTIKMLEEQYDWIYKGIEKDETVS